MKYDYYEILGVPPSATLEEIKKAYRSSAKVYHPDTNTSPSAATMFRIIDDAYKVLRNKDSRAEYDYSLLNTSDYAADEQDRPPSQGRQNPYPQNPFTQNPQHSQEEPANNNTTQEKGPATGISSFFLNLLRVLADGILGMVFALISLVGGIIRGIARLFFGISCVAIVFSIIDRSMNIPLATFIIIFIVSGLIAFSKEIHGLFLYIRDLDK